MNTLMKEMKRSLKELDLGLKGELTITSDMEDLSNSLFFDQVTHLFCNTKTTGIKKSNYSQQRYLQLGQNLLMPQ